MALIVLIGLRGSGKSSVAAALAARLGPSASVIDLDQRTARHAGATSAAEALRRGEPAFRAAEGQALREALDEALHETPDEMPDPTPRASAADAPAITVLALGGGTPMFEPAAGLLRGLRASGDAADPSTSGRAHARAVHIVYLRARAETLRARLARTDLSARPPLLTPPSGAGDALIEIDALMAVRDPVYAALATRVIDTDPPGRPPMTPADAAHLIASSLGR